MMIIIVMVEEDITDGFPTNNSACALLGVLYPIKLLRRYKSNQTYKGIRCPWSLTRMTSVVSLVTQT